MVIRLERLPSNIPVTDKNGKPQTAFTRWWDQALGQIEDNLNRVLDAADAADAANAAAAVANAAAATAQAAADAANAAIAGLGTAAHANTGISGHSLPFLDGTNAFSGSDSFAVVTATRLNLPSLTNAVDDTAAASAGVAINQVYRNGSILMVRVT